MKRSTTVARQLAALLILTALGLRPALADDSAERVLRTLEGFSKDRGSITATTPRVEEKIAANDVVSFVKVLSVEGKTGALTADHWIYDADAVLYDDLDGDGYFRYLSVRIDADSYLNFAYVYAVIYLSADGETWEELYATDDFPINGASSDDEYYVDTELVSGYPPGLYDVLIELYDADTGLYADEFGPLQSPALAVLPLEDASYDRAQIVIVTEHGGGGSASPGFVLALLGLYAIAVRRRRGPAS